MQTMYVVGIFCIIHGHVRLKKNNVRTELQLTLTSKLSVIQRHHSQYFSTSYAVYRTVPWLCYQHWSETHYDVGGKVTALAYSSAQRLKFHKSKLLFSGLCWHANGTKIWNEHLKNK